MNRKELVSYGTNELIKYKIDNPEGESWYLFSHCTGIAREDYIFGMTQEVNDEKVIHQFKKLIGRRCKERIPLQYLLGTQEFMGYTFKVTPDVLIPRADTETVLEEVIATGIKPKKILDMCTGSGCIVISLSLILKPEVCVGVDISENAIKIAKVNGQKLSPMVEFIESDLFSEVKGSYDLIISNPPYITSRECEELMPEVKNHEPLLALDGHEDGLYFYERIIKAAKDYLVPNGMLAFEIGYDQGKAVKSMMEEHGYTSVEIKKDLASLDRLVYGYRKQEGE